MGPKKGRKTTITEDESSVLDNTELLQSIQANETPVWGKSMYTLLNDAIKAFDTKLFNYDHDIKLSIQATTDLADRALSLAESNKAID